MGGRNDKWATPHKRRAGHSRRAHCSRRRAVGQAPKTLPDGTTCHCHGRGCRTRWPGECSPETDSGLRHSTGLDYCRLPIKDLHVPARDAQTILGPARISTTLEIYTTCDEAQRDALTRLHGLLDESQD
jgi:hypothetical protein